MADTKSNASKTKSLGEDPIPRLVFRFTATTLAALLFNSLYTLLDALFVSWGVGDDAMGGVSIVLPFVVLQGAVASAVGGGAASLVSRKLGEGKHAQAGEITANAMAVFYGTAIVVSILGLLFMNPLLSAMGVTQELFPYARQYFLIMLAGNVFSTGFSNIIRAEGKMLYGLLIWVIPISVNTALDILFIFGLKWGVRGAALSTVICQFTSFCMSMLFFKRFTTQVFKGAKVSTKRIREILAIGLPSLIQMGSLSAMSLLLNNVLGSVSGTLGVNTFAYISKIVTFGATPFTAITQALAPIAGYNYGTGNRTRVRKTLSFCFVLAFVYALLAFLLAQIIPEPLFRIFTKDPEIIALGTSGVRIIAAALFFMPLPMLVGSYYQAIGQKLWAFIIYAANLLFMVPSALIAASYFGINGIWWAYVLASALAALLCALRLAVTKKTSKNDDTAQAKTLAGFYCSDK